MLPNRRVLASGGFTLIELMVAVAIVGIIASAAIPYFMRYIHNARNVEGPHNVQKIADSARTYFEAKDRPAATTCGGGTCDASVWDPNLHNYNLCLSGKVYHAPSTIAEFKAQPAWRHLMFQPEGHYSFNYAYETTMAIGAPTTLFTHVAAYRYERCANASDYRYIYYRIFLEYEGGTVRKKGPIRDIGLP